MRTGRVAGVGDVKSCVIAAPARFLTRLWSEGSNPLAGRHDKIKFHGRLAVGTVLKNQPLNH
jgi:hypothetical protein